MVGVRVGVGVRVRLWVGLGQEVFHLVWKALEELDQGSACVEVIQLVMYSFVDPLID